MVAGEKDREVIKFSSAAKKLLIEHADSIEAQMGPGGLYERSPDHASKIAENIARVAGLIHYFEGYEGDIAEETVELAIEICRWSSESYMQLFVPPPQEMLDADVVWQQLYQYRCSGMQYVSKNFARQRAQNAIRKEGRFYRALDVLVARGWIRLWTDARRQEWIILDPNYHPQLYSCAPAPVMTHVPQFQAVTFDPVPNPEEEPSDTI